MKELQDSSGAPSTTIHYYLRHGLLPRPQKTSASRSLYTEEHLRILQRINELKQEGLTLADIEERIRDLVDKANHNKVDVVRQEHERMHNRIMALAIGEFASKGYKNTHITTIIRRLKITPTLLYSHFSSKRRLLMDCVTLMMDASIRFMDGKHRTTDDAGKRILWLVYAPANVFRLGAAALAMSRVEGTADDTELNKPLQKRLDKIVERYVREFQRAPRAQAAAVAVPDELLAQSLFGAYEQTVFSSFQSKTYTRADLLRTHLWLFLAVQAAREGEVDIDSRLAQYEDFIQELGSQMPPLPPQLQD